MTDQELRGSQLLTVLEEMERRGYGYSIIKDDFGIGCVFYPIPHDGKTRDVVRGNDLLTTIIKAAQATKEK